MGFPTVFLVPTKTDEEKLKEKLWEWKATLVVNATKFEPDHPEMTCIEVVSMLDNQQNNDTKKTNQFYENEFIVVEQTFEPPYQQEESHVSTIGTTGSRQEESLEAKTTQQQSVVEGADLEKEQVLLELANQGCFLD